MASANVVAGSNRLKHALRAIQERWQITEATWNDSVRRRFEERQKLADVLDKVRRDCSDPSEMLS
jgi:hypothetical protein